MPIRDAWNDCRGEHQQGDQQRPHSTNPKTSENTAPGAGASHAMAARRDALRVFHAAVAAARPGHGVLKFVKPGPPGTISVDGVAYSVGDRPVVVVGGGTCTVLTTRRFGWCSLAGGTKLV
jgi:hypothetical protein